MRYVQEITDFLFVRHPPRRVDIAFLPGCAYAEIPLHGARMYHAGYAPLLLPSGRFSVTVGRFLGPASHAQAYPGPYESEWAFFRDVLLREAYADDLAQIDSLDEALLAPGVVAHVCGMRVLNLGGFAAALADPHEKQVMWARLKRIPPLGEPF